MTKVNTGNYRLCRQQIGIGGTIETLNEHKSKEEVMKAFEDIEKDSKWNYYREVEVIHKGTQLDDIPNEYQSIQQKLQNNTRMESSIIQFLTLNSLPPFSNT